MKVKRKIEKLTLLLLFLCLFVLIDHSAKTEEAANKEPRFYTIFSGDIGGGIGNYYSNDSDSDNSSTKNDWNDTVYGFAGSIRVCRLSSNSWVMKKEREKQKRVITWSEQAVGGFGVEIKLHQLYQKEKIGEELGFLLLSPEYWKVAKTDLFYKFQSTALTVTPGVQIIDGRLGLFIGFIGVGYTQNHFINYFWEAMNELSRKEEREKGAGSEEEPEVSIETKVAPIVFTILPAKLEWLFQKNMAIGLNFSGLLGYPGKTGFTTKGPSDKVIWILSDTIWLTNFHIGLTLSFYSP